MFISTLNLLLELRKGTLELDIIKQHLQQHSLMNEIEINALMDLTKQIKESITDDEQRVGILNEIDTILLNILQEKRETNSNTDNFLNYVQQSNQNNIGIAILNNYGQFILTDQLTRNILELNILKLEAVNFFSLISKVSQNMLREKFNDCCLLQKGNAKETFQLAMYSKRNKKKSIQYLKQFAKEKEKRKLKYSLAKNTDAEPIQQELILMAKYLKSLQVTISKTNLQLHDDFIESFRDSNDILLHNLSSLIPNQLNQVAVCEIYELDQHLNFSVEALLSDPFIKKNEVKWSKLVRKLGGQEPTYEDFII
uniref:MtB protein n=1 Tax=Paramecium tetraurelia TaxID=5888 RepID=A0A023ZTK0_PARTE|nr:mtB protein [Paramecium tetraurelia]AHY82550.1 mtB protein [Paramecium tetraurelia]